MIKLQYKKILILFLMSAMFIQCKNSSKKENKFNSRSLKQTVLDSHNQEHSLETVLNSLHNRVVLIFIWASWCPECNNNLDFIAHLKEKYQNDLTILFLSIDRNIEDWQKAKKEIHIQGIHFYLGNDIDAPFHKSIDLNWIPRYMVLCRENQIALFRAETYSDPKITEAIELELER